jgi:CRISPR-associated exonuclease Cas4
MTITATHVNYFHICHRKLWLFGNGITMEHTSQAVAEGSMIGKTTYPQRAEKYTEIEIGGSKIDFYDAKNKIIHEIKKSEKMEAAHEWQVKYYIWLLEQAGVENVKGIIEYPKLRQTTAVELTLEDRAYLQQVITQVEAIIKAETCIPVINRPICKRCAYYDFCYIEET